MAKKSKIEKLEEQIESLKAELELVSEDAKICRKDTERFQKMNVELQQRVNEMEISARKQLNGEMRLNLTAISGYYPILWVQTTGKELNHRDVATLKNGIHHAAPDVELILFTTNVASIQEMDDKDLNDIGLARITGFATPQCLEIEHE